MTMIIKSRSEWGAMDPKWTEPIDHKVFYVFIGNTRKNRCNDIVSCAKEAQFIQNKQMIYESDIGYSFLIGGNNVVYEGRGWKIRPKLPKRWQGLNHKSIFIGLMGYFRYYPPPASMLNVVDDLIWSGVYYGHIERKFLEFTI